MEAPGRSEATGLQGWEGPWVSYADGHYSLVMRSAPETLSLSAIEWWAWVVKN